LTEEQWNDAASRIFDVTNDIHPDQVKKGTVEEMCRQLLINNFLDAKIKQWTKSATNDQEKTIQFFKEQSLSLKSITNVSPESLIEACLGILSRTNWEKKWTQVAKITEAFISYIDQDYDNFDTQLLVTLAEGISQKEIMREITDREWAELAGLHMKHNLDPLKKIIFKEVDRLRTKITSPQIRGEVMILQIENLQQLFGESKNKLKPKIALLAMEKAIKQMEGSEPIRRKAAQLAANMVVSLFGEPKLSAKNIKKIYGEKSIAKEVILDAITTYDIKILLGQIEEKIIKAQETMSAGSKVKNLTSAVNKTVDELAKKITEFCQESHKSRAWADLIYCLESKEWVQNNEVWSRPALKPLIKMESDEKSHILSQSIEIAIEKSLENVNKQPDDFQIQVQRLLDWSLRLKFRESGKTETPYYKKICFAFLNKQPSHPSLETYWTLLMKETETQSELKDQIDAIIAVAVAAENGDHAEQVANRPFFPTDWKQKWWMKIAKGYYNNPVNWTSPDFLVDKLKSIESKVSQTNMEEVYHMVQHADLMKTEHGLDQDKKLTTLSRDENRATLLYQLKRYLKVTKLKEILNKISDKEIREQVAFNIVNSLIERLKTNIQELISKDKWDEAQLKLTNTLDEFLQLEGSIISSQEEKNQSTLTTVLTKELANDMVFVPIFKKLSRHYKDKRKFTMAKTLENLRFVYEGKVHLANRSPEKAITAADHVTTMSHKKMLYEKIESFYTQVSKPLPSTFVSKRDNLYSVISDIERLDNLSNGNDKSDRLKLLTQITELTSNFSENEKPIDKEIAKKILSICKKIEDTPSKIKALESIQIFVGDILGFRDSMDIKGIIKDLKPADSPVSGLIREKSNLSQVELDGSRVERNNELVKSALEKLKGAKSDSLDYLEEQDQMIKLYSWKIKDVGPENDFTSKENWLDKIRRAILEQWISEGKTPVDRAIRLTNGEIKAKSYPNLVNGKIWDGPFEVVIVDIWMGQEKSAITAALKKDADSATLDHAEVVATRCLKFVEEYLNWLKDNKKGPDPTLLTKLEYKKQEGKVSLEVYRKHKTLIAQEKEGNMTIEKENEDRIRQRKFLDSILKDLKSKEHNSALQKSWTLLVNTKTVSPYENEEEFITLGNFIRYEKLDVTFDLGAKVSVRVAKVVMLLATASKVKTEVTANAADFLKKLSDQMINGECKSIVNTCYKEVMNIVENPTSKRRRPKSSIFSKKEVNPSG